MVCLTSDFFINGSSTGRVPQIPTITTPNVSDCLPKVLGLIQGGNAFQNPLSGPITDCLIEIASIFGVPGFPTFGPEFNAITSVVNSYTGLLSHTDGLVAAAPSLLAQGSSLINGSVMMGSVGLASVPSNPCELLDGIMGTVLGAANDIIMVIDALLGPIIDAIADTLEAVLGAIVAVLGPLADAIAALASIIAAELANLANFLSDFLNFSTANSLIGIAGDPCLQAILNALGTPDLINCLISSIPNFNVF